MASAKSCDACGAFYKFVNDETQPNGIAFGFFNERSTMVDYTEYKELCPTCLAAVRKVLKDRAEENA
jgi:hypothetical protein